MMNRVPRIPVFALVVGLALGLGLVPGFVPSARAYDPATTHAGLTERSVLASNLHKVLTRRLARPLGLFEPVVLRAADLDAAQARQMFARLTALDPAGGYRPDEGGAAPAVAWVVAGAVIAQVPAERGRNLFYDPARGSGLTEGGGALEALHTLRLLLDAGGGGVRALATGTNFNLTGPPATQWLLSADNDLGLPVFYAELEQAVAAEEPARRGTALARALLALGGTLAAVQDAGEPAHVRNDFRGAYLDSSGEGPFDRSSAFERFVADSYGRSGVPAAGAPVDRPSVLAYITGADAQGLADRTQRRFFSEGTVPEDAVVERDTSAADVLHDARASLAYGLPGVPRLDLRSMGERRYVYAVGEGVGRLRLTSHLDAPRRGRASPQARRVLGYQRVPGKVRFFLDEAVHGDAARALLPEIGAYGAGLIDHLFRGELRLDVATGPSGTAAAVAVTGARGAVRPGAQVRVFAEDAQGRRRLAGTVAAPASGGAASASVALPAGTRRVAAVLRAEDDAGPLVTVAEQSVR